MLEPIRQATEANAREARARAIRVVRGGAGGVALAAIAYAIARSAFSAGFGVAVLVAAAMLSAAALVRAAESKRLALSVLAAVDTADERQAILAIEAARIRTARIVGLYRLAQNIGLALGMFVVIGAAMVGGPFFEGLAVGAVLAVLAEQAMDHDAEERAARYASTLEVAAA